MDTFKSSRPAVIELAARYKELATEAKKGHNTEETDRLLFREMCEICLWGNATDLSLLTSLTYEDIQKLQGSQARKDAEENILVNDLDAAFNALRQSKNEGKAERRVDIVLDNAGFELFVDLILAGYLLSAGIATSVVLRPKVIPWFVSDVVPQDFADLIQALADPQSFYTAPDDSGREKTPLSDKELEEVKFLFDQWSNFHAEGRLIIRPHPFWTMGGSYWRLPHVAPDLFEDLKESELVLFKGDLNYRKLTNDVRFLCPTNTLLLYTVRNTLTIYLTGCLGPYDTLHNRHRSVRPALRHPRHVLPYLQGRCRCWSPRWQRRGTAQGLWRLGIRGPRMGLEWEMGRDIFL